ncbi:hypothetical protein [Streptomyces ardesiacus]|uniref:hypothetical protein n=1 Tax=Streptomyces ardesiacus TaxID=285564 RepID=UPI00380D1AAF
MSVLLEENPQLSEAHFREAGGGLVTLVLTFESARKMRVHRLAKDLKFQAQHCAAQAVAVTMPAIGGKAWEVVPLSYLRELADEAVSTKDQRRLEAALRPRV